MATSFYDAQTTADVGLLLKRHEERMIANQLQQKVFDDVEDVLDRFEMLEVWDAKGQPLRIDATIFA